MQTFLSAVIYDVPIVWLVLYCLRSLYETTS